MNSSHPRLAPLRLGSVTRRSLLRGLSAFGTLALVSCGDDGGGGEQVKAPAETVVVPTPTQAAIASPVPGYLNPEKWAGRTLTIATQGGAYGDAQSLAMFDPFAAATGAQVERALLGDIGEIRQQVENESVAWDVVLIPTEDVLPLAQTDYLVPIDYQIVDRTTLFDEIAMLHAVGAAFFSTVMAYSASFDPAPKTWVDFWNVDLFPGGRALRQRPVGTLEFALVADGVSIGELYPLDVQRAFASLDRIRPHVVQWYDNLNQPMALIESGDAVMASTFNVRAQSAEDVDLVAVQWSGGMISADSWVVPRGSENGDVAMDFINYATRATPSANFSRLVPFGPVNTEAFGLLRDDRLALMPNTPNRRAVQFYQGWNWWADNLAAVSDAFEEWLRTDPEPTGTASPAP